MEAIKLQEAEMTSFPGKNKSLSAGFSLALSMMVMFIMSTFLVLWLRYEKARSVLLEKEAMQAERCADEAD